MIPRRRRIVTDAILLVGLLLLGAGLLMWHNSVLHSKASPAIGFILAGFLIIFSLIFDTEEELENAR